jgi:hypothetical protein
MGTASLALKVYLILGVELVVLYGCMFFVIQQSKKAFYANKTFLGIAFAEAVNQNRQTDICIVQSKATTLFFFWLILFAIISMWTATCFHHLFKLIYPIYLYDSQRHRLWQYYRFYHYGYG